MAEGSQRTILVRDLMTVGVETCGPATPCIEIVRSMLAEDLDAVVVLEDGNAAGVIDRMDLIRAYARADFQDLRAEQLMQENLYKVPADIPAAAAAQMMLDLGVRALFITHQAAGIEYPAAVIAYRHLLRHMAAQSEEDLKDLGIHAERQSPLDTFYQRRDAARKSARS